MIVDRVAGLYPWPVETSDALREALATLAWDRSAETVVRFGYVAGLVTGTLLGVAGMVAAGLFGALAGTTLGLGVVHAVHTLPLVAARLRRTAALGRAPALVSRLVLWMRLSPAPEHATAAVAEAGDGYLAADLAGHVDRARHTGRSALETFGDAWAERFPPLRRALVLVQAAAETPRARRERVLERALATVLSGTRERTETFAATIRGPTTALYAFGVLLPTALVALLPAGAVAGVGITPVSVVFVYDLLLPAVLLGAGAWLLARRPVAFRPPDVADRPDVELSRRPLAVSPVLAVAAWFAATPLPVWGPPVAAVGIGAGSGLWLRYRPAVAVYDELRAAERELPEALGLAGRRIAAGQSVETAVAETAPELDGPLGAAFEACARRQRQLQVTVREGFAGPRGPLARLPSPRVRGGLTMLSLAAREGRPAGEALCTLADHVEALHEIRCEADRELAYVCRTLSSTALVFGPLVAGATVALAGGLGGEAFGGGDLSLEWLGGPVGLYVLVLAVVLTGLSTGLRRGLDRHLLGYRVGRALLSATVVYLTAFVLVAALP